MGVTGLWRLLEPAGKPVPVETLENKVLAVDISIWLHQMVKGYQDAKGAPLPNAHLVGLFQRLCKLLYFRIKPVFVFDGGFPELKKETIAKRQDNKAKYHSESERIKRELALLLSKKTAVNSLLGKQISPKKGNVVPNNNDDMFKLPALPQREESESESEDEQNSSGSTVDLHSVDIESDNFKKLDVKEKYDLLVELKETRKMNSWGRLHELPKKSDTFSDFQMQRLLKRRKVQECLEETEKEMGDSGMSLNDLESLLNEEGIDTKIETLPTRRIASNVTTRFLLIKDMKQALADAKKRDEAKNEPTTSKEENQTDIDSKPHKVDELEDDLQRAIKMSLECVDEANTSIVSKTDDSWTSCLTDTDYSDDSEEYDGFEAPDMTSAKAYIKQYSDFTHRAIDEIVIDRHKNKNKSKSPRVEKIIEEINNEKSVIVDNVDISSEDDNSIQEIPSSNGEEIETVELKIPDDSEENCTQASVICVEIAKDVIELDTTIEENDLTGRNNMKADIKQENHISDNEIDEEVSLQQLTDSSDSDFEEVPEEENKSNKPVVELILNVGDAPDDDIFADIFVDSKNTLENHINKNQYINNEITGNISTQGNLGVNKGINEDESNKSLLNFMNLKAPVQLDTKLTPDVQETNVSNPEILNSLDKTITNTNIKVNRSNSKIEPSIPDKMENKEKTTQVIMNNNTSVEIIDSENIDKQQPNTSNITDVSCFPFQNKKDNGKESIANDKPKEAITTEQLNSMIEELQNEEQNLQQEKGRLDRVGRNITEQMTKEAQELLQIFGIPYIVAPMEAEAQCAFLENVKLTDGTITDDSDIWLFGGRTVYKNFFNQKKHVMQFLSERIEASFNLSREKLVLLALLVGSDYTTGVNGVGPVTALEILASFPFNKRNFLSETSKVAQYTQIVKGLQEFKQWVRSGKRTDNTSLKKKLKNVSLNEDFPSVRVVQAYFEPNIEKSEGKFTWGEIDLTVLRDYTKAKFGWSQNKLDEIIKPVLKRILDRKSQRSMQDYFKRKIEFQSLEEQLSKRVKAAVQRLAPDSEPNELEKNAHNTKPTKRKPSKASGPTSEAGPSASKTKKTKEDSVLKNLGVKVVSQVKDGKSQFDVTIPKTDRYQELIPQRQKDQKNLLENKLKAIELFRKTNIDKKKKVYKRKALVPKERADLSESDSDD